MIEEIILRLKLASWWTLQARDDEGYELQSREEVVNLKDVIDIVQEVAKEGGWIPCSSGQMPKPMQNVITCDGKGNIHVFTFNGECFVDEWSQRITESHERYYVPTAWQPLPKAYKKGE